MNFTDFFHQATGGLSPYPWQRDVAEDGPYDILAIPTGMGKTEGAVLAWAWRRLVLEEPTEPRHLVYCLPMRVLVQQTVERLRACFQRLRSLNLGLQIDVFTLMGGDLDDQWAGLPDQPWVLVGTQDQLLSRALNRGYATSRYDWSVHFGLLNNDCRWIVDEVQLMGPGLWTTSQLDWMRRVRFVTEGPCPTTWMSATLRPDFLDTTDRRADGLHNADRILVMDWEAGGGLEPDTAQAFVRRCEAVRPVAIMSALPDDKLAAQIVRSHQSGTLSLVVCNTVAAARELFEQLPPTPPHVLLTSRFRPEDRTAAEQELYQFEARRRDGRGASVSDHPGLICVSTQVIEAGIDVSAHRLWSEIAPWPSVVQRLGRLNRDGLDSEAHACFWSPGTASKSKWVGPYARDDVDLGKQLLEDLQPLSSQASQRALMELMERYGKELARALRPLPGTMPRAFDVHGLFTTDPDIHGGFTDVSAFVRDVDSDPDATVVWREWDDERLLHEPEGPPIRALEEGCPVPVGELGQFLKDTEAGSWCWDDQHGRWVMVRADEIRPGMVVMLQGARGGYDIRRGWTGNPNERLVGLPPPGSGRSYHEEGPTETGYWCSLDDHLRDAQTQAATLANALRLQPDLAAAVVQAAALHDLGKAHPQWQERLPAAVHLPQPRLAKVMAAVGGGPLAKAPPILTGSGSELALREVGQQLGSRAVLARPPTLEADGRWTACWLLERRLPRHELETLRSRDGVTKIAHVPFRPALRHEATSALAMWHRYRRGQADWSALAVYLAAAHHGKVRATMHSRSTRGEDVCGVPRDVGMALQFRGEEWTLDFTVASDGAEGEWTPGGFVMNGCGWTALVADLLGPWRPGEPWSTGAIPSSEPRALGPFRLAYLEALVRVADWRASDLPSRRLDTAETPA